MRFTFNDAKSHFFSAPVMRKLDAMERKVLSRFGAYVRTSARSLIRRRRRSSRPGEPPSAHTDFLKKNIFFVFDPVSRSVVIGPVRLNMLRFDGDGRPTAGTIPQVIEEGGNVTQIESRPEGSEKWYRKDWRYKSNKGYGQGSWEMRKRVVRYAARPFMSVSFNKNLPFLPDQWRNAL